MIRHSGSELPVMVVWSDLNEDSEALVALDDEIRIASPSERGRARNIGSSLQSKRYLSGHVALRLALSQFTELSPLDLEFFRSPFGKPSLPGTHIKFSYSASSGFVVIALHAQISVGIDVETKAPVHFRDVELDRMAVSLPLISSDEDRSAGVPPPLGQAGWMLLEAFTKLRGERLGENLNRSRPARNVIFKALRSDKRTASAVRFALPGNQFGVCCAGCRSAKFQVKRLDLVLT